MTNLQSAKWINYPWYRRLFTAYPVASLVVPSTGEVLCSIYKIAGRYFLCGAGNNTYSDLVMAKFATALHFTRATTININTND